MNDTHQEIETKVAAAFRKYYFLGGAICSVLLELNGAYSFTDAANVAISIAGLIVLALMVPASLLALIHFWRTHRRIAMISPCLLLASLAFSFLFCAGNPKDWRAFARFIDIAVWGALNVWLYRRTRRQTIGVATPPS
jgi:hypothetical protein